jgi:hypothetical protein
MIGVDKLFKNICPLVDRDRKNNNQKKAEKGSLFEVRIQVLTTF